VAVVVGDTFTGRGVKHLATRGTVGGREHNKLADLVFQLKPCRACEELEAVIKIGVTLLPLDPRRVPHQVVWNESEGQHIAQRQPGRGDVAGYRGTEGTHGLRRIRHVLCLTQVPPRRSLCPLDLDVDADGAETERFAASYDPGG